MNIITIIPARMASSRFPGKPLEKIHGMPMIGHVYLRSRQCEKVNETVVATCNEEIKAYVESIGGTAVMTSEKHETASDRAAEALLKIEAERGTRFDVVVMLQGDEPMVTPEMISAALQPFFNEKDVRVVNLMQLTENEDEARDINEVKLVPEKTGHALYFSRVPLPGTKKGGFHTRVYKQVCVIPFQRNFLLEFNNIPCTELENVESIDMLRILETGGKVRVVESPAKTWSVDTLEDLRRVEEKMKNDKFMHTYARKH